MQNQFVEDLLDLIRLRVKPLLHYSYPWWQPALLVTLLGVFSAAMAEQFSAPPEGRILFFVALNWLELLLMANFFDWWLRQGNRWKGEGSLLPLLAVAQGIQVLEPLLSWLPDDVGVPVSLLLAAYSVVVLINALTVATHVARTHVIGGILLFTPIALALYLSMMLLANSLGWIPDPPEPAAKPGSSQTAPAKPAASKSGTLPL